MLEKYENNGPYAVLAYSIPTAEDLSQKLMDAGLDPDGKLQPDKLLDGMTYHQTEDKLHEALEPYIGKKPKWGEDGYTTMKSAAHDAREAHLTFMTFLVAKWKGKINEVAIRFSGYGDSGDMRVEKICDVDGKVVVPEYPTWITNEEQKAKYRIDHELETEFLADFDKWGDSFVKDCVINFDWYNNDGGDGDVWINLDTGECTLEGNQNVSQARGNSINFNGSDGGKVARQATTSGL